MKKTVMLLSILIALNCKGQPTNSPCNKKSVHITQITIPQEVCIPKGYVILHIFDAVDLNNDGLEDFVFRYGKENLMDGDTLFLAIYFHQNDSSYYLAKTLPNIYPIFFEEYSAKKYRQLTPNLKTIMDRYRRDPFRGLNFIKGQIEVKFAIDAVESYTLVFNYDAKQNTWILKKRISYLGYKNETTEYDIEPEKQIPIEKFDYMDWL